MKTDVIVAQKSYFITQSYSLGNATFKFYIEWRILVHLMTDETYLIQIGHLYAHLLHHSFGKCIRGQNGNLIVYILHATKIPRGHNGRRINFIVILLNKHRTSSLIDFGRIAIVNETNGQSHHNKDEEQIPMIQKNKNHLFYVNTLFLFILLGIVCLSLVCHGVLNN